MKDSPTLQSIEFTKEQRELICSILNRFGLGQHPFASGKTFDYFMVFYLKNVLNSKKFIESKSKLSDIGKKTLLEIEAILMTKTGKHYSEIKYTHKPSGKIYSCNGAGGLVDQDYNSPLPLWLTENSIDWIKL